MCECVGVEGASFGGFLLSVANYLSSLKSGVSALVEVIGRRRIVS